MQLLVTQAHTHIPTSGCKVRSATKSLNYAKNVARNCVDGEKSCVKAVIESQN